ncbi:hypothetical protein EBT16_15070, partial [bacterium]|nr:hypothetical protein [bacterium]
WNAKNPECNKKSSQKWYQKNKKKARKNVKNWEEKNQERKKFYSASYRARKKQAMPLWADQEKINWFYLEATRLTAETGIEYHVDHIFPLKNRYLCGLHVHENLQLLTATENFSKNNRQWPGQLSCQKD